MHLHPCLSARPRPITGNRILVSAVLSLLPSLLTAQILSLTHYSDLIDVEDEVTVFATVQTLGFNQLSQGTYTEVGNTVPIADFASLNGFAKFDPALGTLNEVRFTIEVWAYAEVEIESFDIVDPSAAFSLEWDPEGMVLLQTSIIYSPTGGSAGYSITFDTGGFGSVIGDLDQDPSDWGADEGEFFYSAVDWTEYGGFAPEGGNTATSGSLLTSDPIFVVSDFVGDGTVSGLGLVTSGEFDTSNILLENLSEAYISAFVGLDPGTVTLEYIYTPVPEPAAAAFLAGAAAIVLLITRSRRLRVE